MDNEVARFLAERCVRRDGLRIARAPLYAAYQHWCFSDAAPELSNKRFCAELRKLGVRDIRVSGNGGTGFGWDGIALQETPEIDGWKLNAARFFRECCFFEEGATVDKDDLYNSYVSWCGLEKVEAKNQRQLSTELRKYGDVYRTTFSRGDKKIHPGWRGVGLRLSKSLRL